jgi:hypothetical protein
MTYPSREEFERENPREPFRLAKTPPSLPRRFVLEDDVDRDPPPPKFPPVDVEHPPSDPPAWSPTAGPKRKRRPKVPPIEDPPDVELPPVITGRLMPTGGDFVASGEQPGSGPEGTVRPGATDEPLGLEQDAYLYLGSTVTSGGDFGRGEPQDEEERVPYPELEGPEAEPEVGSDFKPGWWDLSTTPPTWHPPRELKLP